MNCSLCFYWTKLFFPWSNSFTKALKPHAKTILNSVCHHQPQQNIPKSCLEKQSRLQNLIFLERVKKGCQSTQKERKVRGEKEKG